MKGSSRHIITLLVLWVGLAVVFAFADLGISQALFDPAAGWAKFIEAYGQIPGVFVGFACGSILLHIFKVKKSARSIAGAIGLFLLVLFAALFLVADASGAEVGAPLNLPLIGVLGLALTILAQVILRLIPAGWLVSYKPAARVGLTLLYVAGLITVWAIKIPWGRWTYRDILAAGDLALFTPWYLPQGFNGHFSFISAHAALAFCVLPAALFFNQGSRARDLAFLLVGLWGIVVALGRVVLGAHFASDVLFGACEAILWFLLLTRWSGPDI